MISAKQRSYLKSLANPMKPLVQIGKEGVNDRLIAQLNEVLDAHELVKVSILENAVLDARETAILICQTCRAEFVQAIGNRFTVYRKNHDNPKIDLSQQGIKYDKNQLSKAQLSETAKKNLKKKSLNPRAAKAAAAASKSGSAKTAARKTAGRRA